MYSANDVRCVSSNNSLMQKQKQKTKKKKDNKWETKIYK